MALPRSLVQPFRKNTLVVGAGWRAYFAPYNYALGSAVANTVLGPTILDMAQGPFATSGISPAGWTDTGWIKDFKLTPGSKIGQVRSGYRGAVRAQYRGQVDESFEFKFREYGRLQYKLSTGSNVFNLLAGGVASTVGPVSATGSGVKPAMVSYNPNVPSLTVATGSGSLFAIGDYIAVDIDYNTATFGLVGDAGTPVFQNAVTDVDFIRKNTDYVARVVAVNADVLTLDQAFVGGGSGNPTGFQVPQAGSKVQKIKGFVAREGGTFISEWSALFTMDTMDISQLAVYYPHVSIMQNRDNAAVWALENAGTTDLSGHELDAQFQALAFDDPIDGETVVGYKAFYPAPGASIGY